MDYTFVHHLQAFGNLCADEGAYCMTEMITAAEEQPFYGEDFERFLLDPHRFALMIRDRRREFAFRDEDYARAGADLRDDEVPLPAKILRLLAAREPAVLFYTDRENLIRLGRSPDTLRLFLELPAWQHPDVIEMESPAELACFQSLAGAIARRDASVFTSDASLHNSHWTHWEWYRAAHNNEDDDDLL